MVLTFRQKFVHNYRNLMREAGYFEIFDRRTGKFSYSRKLRDDHYPRYHVYVNQSEPNFLRLSLHLDMKKPSYEGASAHSGEYEGELVEREASRINGVFGKFTAPPEGSAAPNRAENKLSFWEKIFGVNER